MKKTINWRLKIIAKIILSRVPVGYKVWRRLGLFRHGSMDQSSYTINVFNQHILRAGMQDNLKGKVILELGPGDSVATALMASCFGAKAILLDAGEFATTEIEIYKKLARELEKRGIFPPENIYKAKNINDFLLACGARYLTRGLESFSVIKDSSVDLIFSQAVLEHVRKHEFLETMIECKRVLSKDGIASHEVDLKDHLGGALNNLRFKNELWESNFFVRSGFYTNRIRFSEMITLFKKAGFETDISNIKQWEHLPISRNSLSNDFLYLTDDDLKISEFAVRMKIIAK